MKTKERRFRPSFKFILIFVVLIIFYVLGLYFSWELPGAKTTKNFVQQDSKNVYDGNPSLYYWSITSHRTGFAGKLPDRFRVYTLKNDLVFDSTRTKPFFSSNVDLTKYKIKTSLQQNSDKTVFSQTYIYPFAEVSFNFVLYQNQKYVDLKSSVKYSQNHASEFEGFSIDLTHKNEISYFDEAYNLQKLNKPVIISQWSPHIIESKGLTLTDNSAEVMELGGAQAKFYSYYGSTRESVFRRDYAGANKAEPKIDLNIKRSNGEVINLNLRAIITPDKITALPFRWPYAKDSVLTYTIHADLGNFMNVKTDLEKRFKAVYFGSSDSASPDYGKKGLFAHNLRLTQTVWPVNVDNPKEGSFYSSLENDSVKKMVTELYRRGIDIGAHRLADSGIGASKDVAAKIKSAFDLISQFNPTVWIDHSDSGDCVSAPEKELISGCGSITGNKLNMIDKLAQGTWKYIWADGQDSQNKNYKDYTLNAFSTFKTASQILYYYQGAQNAIIPNKFMIFASSLSHENEMFTESEIQQLAQDKGFNNTHTYFQNYGPAVLKASLPTGKKDAVWNINPKLEDEFTLLDKYQSQDKIWVRDFTTVADYLQSWKNVQIIDFTDKSLTIKNNSDQAIIGLTLFAAKEKISAVSSSGVYYPYIRDQYVVLPKLEANEEKTVLFAFGEPNPTLPQILNFADKQIEISDISYVQADKNLKIAIGPTGKPGQNLTITDTEIKIQIPSGSTPSITRDGHVYTNTDFANQILTIKTDTNKHNFEIKI